MKLRNLSIAMVTVIILGSVCLAVATYFFQRPQVLRLAVDQNSEDFATIQAAQQVLSRDREKIRFKIIPVNSAAAAAAALENGSVDLAVVRTYVKFPDDSASLVILHHDSAVLVACAHSKIEKIEDFKNKSIALIKTSEAGEDIDRFLDAIFKLYDLPLPVDGFQVLSPSEAASAMQNGTLDAALVVGVSGNGMIGQTLRALETPTDPLRLIPIVANQAIAQQVPMFETQEIVSGSFGGAPPRPKDTYETLAATTRLAAKSNMPDDWAANVVIALFSKHLEISRFAPLINNMEAPATTKGQILPTHSGVTAYIDDEEQSFMDKNSDYIYIGAMIIGIFGSAFAALASRLGLFNYSYIDKVLERMLDLTIKAKQAQSLTELEGIQQEADDILSALFGHSALKGFSATARGLEGYRGTLLTLILERLHHNSDERRALLKKNSPANDGSEVRSGAR